VYAAAAAVSFEANVPARFSVLDDRDQNEMMERASLQVLLNAAAAPDSAEGRALTTAMTSAADSPFATWCARPASAGTSSGVDRACRLDRCCDGATLGDTRRRSR